VTSNEPEGTAGAGGWGGPPDEPEGTAGAGGWGGPPDEPEGTGRIGGWCDPHFTAVRDAFAANFTERGETGAAACLIVHGTVVADLWGGRAAREPHRPWQRDTLVNVFSVGKGLVAACAARLAGQRMLDPDAPVTWYWPDFGAAGKRYITVRSLLSHQAGLPALRARVPVGSALDWPLMVGALAAEPPWWPPGTGHGYHVNTFGFLAGELIRRVTGRTVGAVLRDELAGPLGADVHIGLPAADHGRVADFDWPGTGIPVPPAPDGTPPEELMIHNAYANPADLSGWGVVNTAAWRAAEVPSANAHATAAGVARIYAALAGGGAVDGVRVVDSGALADAVTEQVDGDDLVLRRPSRFGLGFQLTQPERPLGPGPRAFGHFGAGGSVGFCDPDAGVAFGYVTGQMGPRWQNPRNRALIDAVFACL
jgi:CubicO group peptidase (beta-lactamase class C family)